MQRLGAVGAIAVALLACGCAGRGSADETETQLDQARRFEAYPLYWVGERFEKWRLEDVHVENAAFATFIYGTCEIDDPDGLFGPEGGTCSPPLQIQISPLCRHLESVTRAPIWKRRRVRGAPVGTIDSAPVLLTTRAQVKVYSGVSSDPGLRMRALHALRSINRVPPLIETSGPIPASARAIPDGSQPCSPGAKQP